jgi:hypothetical protein
MHPTSMEDLFEGVPFDPQLAYCLACTVAFAQGAAVSSSLIAQAQHMKAAAVLKQDIELLARFREIGSREEHRRCLPSRSGHAEPTAS